jgi:ABC-type antimicrobial peptide transport system permease subunit
VDTSLRGPRFLALLVGLFALLGCALAAVGIYGVVAFSTLQRTDELGIRIALGARPADVYRLVLRDSLSAAAAGIAIGVLATVALARILEASLFGLTARDPLTLAVVALLLAVIASAATLIPARRAAAINPRTVLKN